MDGRIDQTKTIVQQIFGSGTVIWTSNAVFCCAMLFYVFSESERLRLNFFLRQTVLTGVVPKFLLTPVKQGKLPLKFSRYFFSAIGGRVCGNFAGLFNLI